MRLYMSLIGIVSALFMSIFSVFYSAEKSVHSIQPIEHKQCKAIVFDLGGVVFDTNKQATLWQIGPRILFDFWRNAQSSSDLQNVRQRFYALMHAANPHTSGGNQWGIKDEEGKEVPQLMAEWLRGIKPNNEIYQTIKLFAKNNPAWFTHTSERRTLLNICRLTFDPERFIKTRKLFPESAQLIKECKERGFKLYVLSNWDRESGKMLVKKYPSVFELFDGIIFSGDVQQTKPEREIFSHITNILPAQECVLIDDQPENIDVARSLGFNTILVHHDSKMMGSQPNLQAVRDQLQAIHPFSSPEKAVA